MDTSINQKCIICGKSLKNKRRGAIYCSRECNNKNIISPRPKVNKNCLQCGKGFLGRASALYCSKKCYRNYYYHIPKTIKVCPFCNKEFIANYSTQKTCGKNSCSCALYQRDNKEYIKKYKHDRYKKTHPKKSYKKQCAFCGEAFETLRKPQKYCSIKCNIARYRGSEKHKLVAVIDYHKRRGDKKTNVYSVKDWHNALEFFKRRCAYCGKKTRLHQDHFIPLKLGGAYIKGNILPACPSCNYKKNAQHPIVFLQSFENGNEILKRIREFFAQVDLDQVHRKASPVDNWRL